MKFLKVFALLCWCFLIPASLQAGVPFWPNDPYFFYNPDDLPNYPGQWHLVNADPAELQIRRGSVLYDAVNAGADANVKSAWSLGYKGKGVVIGIVDDCVQGDHPEAAGGTSRSFMLTATDIPHSLRQTLEEIQLDLKWSYTAPADDYYFGHTKGTLVSPSTMKSTFMNPVSARNQIAQQEWSFITNAFWGEDPLGTWNLNLTDTVENNQWRWDSYNVTFFMDDIVFFDTLPATQTMDIKARSFGLREAGSSYTHSLVGLRSISTPTASSARAITIPMV